MSEIFIGRIEHRKSIISSIYDSSERANRIKCPIFSSVDVASFFQPWINFCYYILIIPFKIQRNDKTYYYATNVIQKVLCGIIQPIVGLNALFEIRGAVVGKVREDPAILVHVVDRTNTALFCYIFFYTVWLKKDAMLAIFNDADPKEHIFKITRSVQIYCVALLSFSTFAFVSAKLLRFELEKLDFAGGFKKFSDQLEFEFGFTNKTYNKWSKHQHYYPQVKIPEPETRISVHFFMISIITLFIRFYKWILVDMMISLTGVTSFVCFKLSKKFKELMLESVETGEDDFKVLHSYAKLKELVDKFNDFIGPICVVVFVSMIAFCAVSTVDILDSEGWSFPFIMSIYFTLSSSMMIFSAEAHYQTSYFKTWLLTHRKNSPMSVIDYLEAENCNLAIKGGRLFTITYGFLGTVSSVVLTYAIIMIQFTGGSSTTSQPIK